MKSDVFGLEGSFSVGTEREAELSGQNIPHPENAHDGFPTTDVLLLFLFSLAIFDCAKISLRIDTLSALLDRRRRAECLLHHANTLLHQHVPARNDPISQIRAHNTG